MRTALEGKAMLRAAMTAPYLERDEEHDLALRWRDNRDQQALNRIARAHMRLVISMALKFRSFGLAISDLVQEGHVGLLEAAMRFDPERNVRFSTYATWWIRASMQDFVLRNWSIVRGGTNSTQKALFFNLRRLRAKIGNNGEALANDEIYAEIAVALGVSKSEVARMDCRLSAPDTSLNSLTGTDENGTIERIDFLVSDEPLPDETAGSILDEEKRRSWLRSAMKALDQRELHIIRKRRLSEDGMTLEQLGTEMGISKERVRQIEHRALEKLKGALISQNPDRAVFFE